MNVAKYVDVLSFRNIRFFVSLALTVGAASVHVTQGSNMNLVTSIYIIDRQTIIHLHSSP